MAGGGGRASCKSGGGSGGGVCKPNILTPLVKIYFTKHSRFLISVIKGNNDINSFPKEENENDWMENNSVYK